MPPNSLIKIDSVYIIELRNIYSNEKTKLIHVIANGVKQSSSDLKVNQRINHKSRQAGLLASIKANFFFFDPALICFSR